jgi:hypothetical protein
MSRYSHAIYRYTHAICRLKTYACFKGLKTYALRLQGFKGLKTYACFKVKFEGNEFISPIKLKGHLVYARCVRCG